MKSTAFKLSEIVTTAGTQIRARIDNDTVDQYANDMIAKAEFPPVVLFHDGSQYILADGFHRVMAATRNGVKTIEAWVRKGTKSDALKFALSANCSHGLQRSNLDKRRSVELALSEWPKVSDREIARICAVDHTFVGRERRELVSNTSSEKRTGGDGKERRLPIRTAPPAETRTKEQQEIDEIKKIVIPPEDHPSQKPAEPEAVTLKALQIVFEEGLKPLWIKADKKTKREFINWISK